MSGLEKLVQDAWMSFQNTFSENANSTDAFDVKDIAAYIDHTILKPDVTEAQIVRLCAEAREYQFASVCVNPVWVPFCKRELENTPVMICTVAGFPLGASTTMIKATEAAKAVQDGADEVDMVMNIGALKDGEYDAVFRDMEEVVKSSAPAAVKVIIETCLLDDKEKVAASVLVKEAGAHFVKTSTGFSTAGATEPDVALMRRVVGSEFGVKAAGGIRDAATARAMIRAGASRIGASASVAIVSG